MLPRLSGRVSLHGRTPPRSFHQRVRDGLALVPEERAVVRRLTVLENIKISRASADAVFGIFPELLRLRHQRVGMLSGGEQQMLALGRALARKPKLLMIDELSLGLAPVLVSQIFRLIAGLRDEGVAILLSEQNARLSLAIADRGYVIEKGRVTVSGTGQELLHSADIAERYLGVGAALAATNGTRDQTFTQKLRDLMQS